MARFDVYANPYAAERQHTPFLLDVQNDFLGPLATRVVIPLRTPKSFGSLARGLNPTVLVSGKQVVVDTAAIAPVPTDMLNSPVLRSAPWRAEVMDALDTLFGSY